MKCFLTFIKYFLNNKYKPNKQLTLKYIRRYVDVFLGFSSLTASSTKRL